MAWQVTGRSMELCNCKVFCPCWLGAEGEPDQGSCASIFGFDIESGNSDGLDLAGTKVVFMARWPGNFFAGGGSARLFIDEGASADQQRELEAIFSGRKGGLLEGLWGAVLSNWHPVQACKVELTWGDTAKIAVAGIGGDVLEPLLDGAGKQATLTGAAAQAAFQIETMVLSKCQGGSWSDPDLGDWQTDSSTLHNFDWAA